MVTIEVATHAGACFGVNRALTLVQETLARAKGPVYTLGPLIHNPTVVSELAAQGAQVARALPRDPLATLVLRSHGVTPALRQQAQDRGLKVVDATCPYVKKAQRAAQRLAQTGYQVVVVGEAGHPEVEGILAYAPGAVLVASPQEVLTLSLKPPLGLVAQTTQSEELYNAVEKALRARYGEVVVAQTICLATHERQNAAQELAQRADLMVVIGGKNSANTTRLATLCKNLCKTIHIERAQELTAKSVAGAAHIGITAGASTPLAHIERVVEAVQALTSGSLIGSLQR